MPVHLSLPLFALALASGQTPPPDAEPEFRSCSVSQEGGFGRIWYTIEVLADGTPAFHRIQWQAPERPTGYDLQVTWDGEKPNGPTFEDRAWARLKYKIQRPVRRARLELRRSAGERYHGEFAYSGSYQRSGRWPGSRLHYVESELRWGELTAWMSGRGVLWVALVDPNGRVLAQDQLSAATLARASEAIGSARAALAPMIADAKNHCKVPEPMIVAGPRSRPLSPRDASG